MSFIMEAFNRPNNTSVSRVSLIVKNQFITRAHGRHRIAITWYLLKNRS